MSKIFNADLIGKKQSVIDEFLLLQPHTTPLLSMVGFSAPVYNTTHEWVEDEMFAYESALNGAILAAATSVVVDDVEPFAVGHVAKIGEEMVLVTAVNAGTKTLTVTRGYAGTTATDKVDNAKIEVLFREGQEGASFAEARAKARKIVSNKSQIFSESISVSGSALETAQYGIEDLYETEKQKKQIELALQLEKMMINGLAFDNGVTRQGRGIRSFLQTNVKNAGGALTMAHINDLAQDIYEKGGFAGGGSYVLLAGAKQKRAMSGFDKEKVQIAQGSGLRGDIVDAIVTDFGQFQIAINNNLASDEIMLVDLNRIKLRPLGERSFAHTYEGKLGDYVKGNILGEYVLELKQEKAHGIIKGLA